MEIMDTITSDQPSIIMQHFQQLKSENTKLKQDNKDLELLGMRQRERLVNAEKNRHSLIKLLREKVEKVNSYKSSIATLEELQIKNSNLSAVIQSQKMLIDEQLETIANLKKENALLKIRRYQPNNIIERGIEQSAAVIKHVISINGTNGNQYCHPSFDPPSSEVPKKKKKKSPKLIFQNRYSNLDISVNGTRKNEENRQQSNSPEENRQTASGKKRRLFSSLEDEMIDLTIDNQE